MSMLPAARPRLSSVDLLMRLSPYAAALDRARYPLVVVSIRGYYLDTLGVKGKNDRGIYDDAIFIHSPNVFAAFNGNADPSIGRTGIATLAVGCYFAHILDKHKGQYLALCQRVGEVTVRRDGQGLDHGRDFGINLHRGGINTTSSEGCLTIPPGAQWNSAIALLESEARRLFGRDWNRRTIPVIQLEDTV